MNDLFTRANGQARIDVSRLYGPFLVRLKDALTAAQMRGSDCYPTCGWRSFEEQDKRWKAYKAGTGTRAAPAGMSAHNYGIAVDVVPDGDLAKPGLQADYSTPAYRILGEEVRKSGLVWGDSFGDRPHIQAPDFVRGRHLAVLRRIWQRTHGDEITRLRATWVHLDNVLWSD